MTNYMSTMPMYHISSYLAEDAGAPELRNPLTSGMRFQGWLSRLFSRIGK